MAREKMVTRTIQSTVVEVLMINVDTADVEIREIEIPGTHTVDTALNAVRPFVEVAANIKAAAVRRVVVQEKLYGMSESVFLKYAKELPPRANKAEE